MQVEPVLSINTADAILGRIGELLINDDLAFRRRVTELRLDRVVVQRLVRAILIVMINELVERTPQVFLA